jgi:hypothetical protein
MYIHMYLQQDINLHQSKKKVVLLSGNSAAAKFLTLK